MQLERQVELETASDFNRYKSQDTIGDVAEKCILALSPPTEGALSLSAWKRPYIIAARTTRV